MKKTRYKKYLIDQKKEMEKYKWITSEKAKKNLGEQAIIEWVKKYAKKFRKKWVLKDIKLSLKELNIIKKKSRGSEKGKIFMKFILDIIEKTEEALELLETENGNDKKTK